MSGSARKVLALSGGVGGAKLALGLADCLAPDQLHVLVNTGDDFSHLGLHISPDIDTLLYTLSGRSNTQLGWGLAEESWRVMESLEELGGESWFRLGDRDLATHLWRTQALANGQGLAQITSELGRRMGIKCAVHPMSEDPVRTIVDCDEGALPFQHYFVRRQCEPAVTGFRFEGITQAKPNQSVLDLLHEEELAGVVLCPSNPFVSIDPILQLPGMSEALMAVDVPVVAVSPIVAGMAIKGPAAKMMAELGIPVTALAVAQHYADRYPGLLDTFVIDQSDATLAPDISRSGIDVVTAQTIMKTRDDKQALARTILQLLEAQ